METSARPLTQAEAALLRRLLELPWNDRERFLAQSRSALALTIDDFGSFAIDVPGLLKQFDCVQVPYAEGQTKDVDGVLVWITLFIKNAVLDEVDIVRADGLPLIQPLSPHAIDVFAPATLKTPR